MTIPSRLLSRRSALQAATTLAGAVVLDRFVVSVPDVSAQQAAQPDRL